MEDIEPLPQQIAALYDQLPALHYLVLTPASDLGFTPFQGFSADVVKPLLAPLVELMAVLPASVLEIFAPPNVLPALRRPLPQKNTTIAGMPTYRVLSEHKPTRDRIAVVIGFPSEITSAMALPHDANTIFLTTKGPPGAVSLSGYKGHLAQAIDVVIRDAAAALLPNEMQDAFLATPLRAPFPEGSLPSRGSGVTMPNELLSVSLGHAYNGSDNILSGEASPYVDAIIDSANCARRIIGETSTNIVLYAPSIVRRLYAFGSSFWNNLLRNIPRELREIVKDGLFRNPNYSGFSLKLKNREPRNPYEDPIAGPILSLRQSELRLMTAGISALATSGTQPAIRLPNSVNFHASTLREIERHSERVNERNRKILQLNYKRLSHEMLSAIDTRIIEELSQRTEAITLVADAPIEWLRIDGIPLMIRHELSRIGMTPGNLMLALCAESGMHSLPASALDDVIVVRSFAHDDPIRNSLEDAIQIFNLARVKVRFVDVTSQTELISCLNSYQGAIAIFDCHGGHGGDESHGWLKIGNERVDTWQLAHITRIPPIVVLSACSTFALAGSHASVANGLIRSGAITVVGTFLPVNALRSAAFVARLLYRIDVFLPALKALDKNYLTWRSLVSTFLRMSYATDLLQFFIDDKNWLEQAMFMRIGPMANQDINLLRSDWHERLVRRIAWASRKSRDEVLSAIENDSPLLETMYYCQIGRPETLGIWLGDVPIN
ncbi:hypothetical protein [Lysobacter sp. Root604]|uniref:hypothetical protein n=1 Tax=Lysobacter sp. Root604 TaxID=1736568 RepID=UPI000A76D269|nr:hypothetical protein [Lysobacter sp. Root604]